MKLDDEEALRQMDIPKRETRVEVSAVRPDRLLPSTPSAAGAGMSFVKADDLFEKLFHVASSALRLETRESYGVPYEHEPLARYLAGKPVDTSYTDAWSAYIRDLRAAGKMFRRVRVMSVPLSGYQRFGLAQAAVNDTAGEDVRYLDRASPTAAALPRYDYWVFDEQAVGVLEFDPGDDLLGAHVVRDAAFVAQHLTWLRAAWPWAVPYRDFRAVHPVADL
jgi:hypothetical protein